MRQKIYVSYCQSDPVGTELQATLLAMPRRDRVDVEDALQRWGKWGPEEEHIHSRVGSTSQILARTVYGTGRYLVAVFVFGNNEIIVESAERGRIEKALAPAFLYLGPPRSTIVRNPRWTG